MDVKTLSAITGHVSAKTTLNVYTHVTDAMQQTAAEKLTKGSAGANRRTKSIRAVKVYPLKCPTRAQRPPLHPTGAKSANQGQAV